MIFVNGLPETACGGGSTLKATRHLRIELPILLRKLHIQSMVDAPCGDFNWMAKTDLSGIAYLGRDINSAHLVTATEKAKRGHRAASVEFAKLDIVTKPLPRADLLFCRDFLQHLPTEMAMTALRNFVASGSKWLLVTSHVVKRNKDINEPGQFRPLNMKAEPFSLPMAKAKIWDPPGSRRIMALWPMEDVARSVG